MAFEIHSEQVRPNDTIPTENTCDGDDVSPQLAWSGAPARTRAFALIVHDPDAPRRDWVHWVVFDLPASTTSLPPGVAESREIDGGIQGKNDFGKLGWGGPCPPPGSAHRYVFELYALDAPLGLEPGSTRAQVERAMKGHVLAQTKLESRYARLS